VIAIEPNRTLCNTQPGHPVLWAVSMEHIVLAVNFQNDLATCVECCWRDANKSSLLGKRQLAEIHSQTMIAVRLRSDLAGFFIVHCVIHG
jgi:hypothetical protein